MTKAKWLYTFEIALGCLFALAIAFFLKLENYYSAGIIAILSIQSTKKQAILIALERVLLFIVALVIAFLCSFLVSSNILAFCIFVFIFTLICIKIDGLSALSISCVLISHFFIANRWDMSFIFNELKLLFIGVGFGLILNMLTPISIKKLKNSQRDIENLSKTFLLSLSWAMTDQNAKASLDEQLDNLKAEIDMGHKLTHEYKDNLLITSSYSYYEKYMVMRELQYTIFYYLSKSIKEIDTNLPQISIVSAFLVKISSTFHESNDATMLIAELVRIKNYYKQSPLPKTRYEFEQRAILYRVLIEIEHFLIAKSKFIKNLTYEESKIFHSSMDKR